MSIVCPCYVFPYAVAPGAWNMAFDEALAELAAAENVATLRWYGWSEPTLSLGYFQAVADRVAHRSSVDCPLVRRASGGGAILHDVELTYSLTMPTGNRRSAADALRFYGGAHASIIRALVKHRVATGGIVDHPPRGTAEPFLCFQRRSKFDVLLADHKIVGSAQRRHRGAILQHGSILLAKSARAPELPGIADLTGAQFEPEQLANAVQTYFAECLRLEYRSGSNLLNISERAAEIERDKFAAADWTYRR